MSVSAGFGVFYQKTRFFGRPAVKKPVAAGNEGEKRWRAAAVQNAGAFTMMPGWREASWSAPALWRFGRRIQPRRGDIFCRIQNQTRFQAPSGAEYVALLNALFDRGFNYELQNRFQTLEEFVQRINELLQTSPSLPTETLEVIAQRESAFFYETDRKTLLAKLRADCQVVTNLINQTLQSVTKKLTGTLFSLSNAQMYQSLDPKDGDEIWGRHFDLRVQNHMVLVRIQFFIACKGSECVALRRISDLSQNNQVLRTETSVLTRYDARLGKPDANLIASNLEVAVGLAIPRLRTLTQS